MLFRQLNREEIETIIALLAKHYPACFFLEPKQRRPLKKNIVADIQREGFPIDSAFLTQAVTWYEQRFAYQYALQAGACRVNLDGKEVAVVTEQEYHAARRYIADRKEEMSLRDPIRTTIALHKAGAVPDDALRKIPAPAVMPHRVLDVVEPAPVIDLRAIEDQSSKLSDDEIRQRIKARRAGYRKNFVRKLLGLISLKLDEIYTTEDLQILIERTGRSYVNAMPLITYGVQAGYLDRVGRGQYRVTGKHVEEAGTP
jgi:sRNA-binding protein